ncbi:MAG: M14 family metallopeptidase [bacterium]|nr:M14 family metallopeptidase [bacterium]
MKKKLLFELKSLYRDSMRIYGYEFGEGRKSACIVGAMRGNEVQQMLSCGQLVKVLKQYEAAGKIENGKSILVIPSVNPYSMNIGKRFWPTDDSDINRMFPGYNKGETTQRIAAAVFEQIKDYENGIQFASFYIPGAFLPHVRMMKTGYENKELARKFGMPYVILRDPRPYDSATLNFNWQIWEANAFSVYTHDTNSSDMTSIRQGVDAVITFLSEMGIVNSGLHGRTNSHIINEADMVNVKSKSAGMFRRYYSVNDYVKQGEKLAEIIDPYDFTVIREIISPVNGTIFFTQQNPLSYANAVLFKLIEEN